MSDIIMVNQLEVASDLASDIVILFSKIKHPEKNFKQIKEFITDGENYVQSAQELFNFWYEFYFDKLEKAKVK